jgi:hypothetical protein
MQPWLPRCWMMQSTKLLSCCKAGITEEK